MNYIWDNIDIHLSKEQITDFLKLDGINLDTPDLLKRIKERKLSYSSLGLINKDSYILDIGCGLGEDCIDLANLTGNNGKVIGIDISDTLTKEATSISIKHKINNIIYQTMDAHKLDYQDYSFDTVCIRRSLQHMINPQAVLNESLRVLKPGGRIIIIEPDRGSSILNHPNRQMTRMIMTYIEEIVRNPWIGRQLKQLMTNKYINSLSINYDIDVLTTYQAINNNFGIEQASAHLVNLKLLSHEQAHDWLNIIKELDTNHQLFCSTTQFIATGLKTSPTKYT
jgi:ubiquinone/menaquinone biosynthesis C-methylase UbiE